MERAVGLWFSRPMRQPARGLLTVAAIAALTVPLAACDRYSATCDTGSTCEIEIQGTSFHEFPRPYDASEGIENNGAQDRIRLVSASAGGEAVIQAGGDEHTCAEGQSFVVVDTTITCEVVGDEKVELTSTRS